MKRIIIEFLIGLPVVVLLYLLFEFLYAKLITRSDFVFNFGACMFIVGVWLVVEIVTYTIRKKKEKDKK